MSHDVALRVARQLLQAGATLFVTYPDPEEKSGYKLRKNWAGLPRDENVLRSWRPGYGLAMVCGGPFDVIDIDPRNGGSLQVLRDAPFTLPKVYAEVRTPSGGVHLYIAALNVHKAGNILPGIDLQAGAEDGRGRGFVFLPPTSRVSKEDGETREYTWAKLSPGSWRTEEDESGASLRAWLTSNRPKTTPKAEAPGKPPPRVQDTPPRNPPASVKIDKFLAPKQDVLGNPAAALEDGRHNGVVKIAGAAIDTGMSWDDYAEFMEERIWPLTQEASGAGEYDWDEFQFDLTDCWERWHKDTKADPDAIPQGSALSAPALADMLVRDGLTEWRVDPEENAWYRWEAPTWENLSRATVHRVVADFLADLHQRAVRQHADESTRKVIRTWRDTPGRADHLLKLAAGDPAIQLTQGFDTQPYILNTDAGVIDLQAAVLEVREPRLTDYVRKSTGVAFDPDATHADWDTALTSIEDAEARAWFQVYMGAALIGRPPDDASVLFQVGGGANGKTTITDAIVAAMGDYATMASDKILLGSADSIPTEVMDLAGRRLAIVEELPQGRHMNLARLKQLTGGKSLRARALYRNTEEFPVTHTLVINSNFTPRVPEVDHGTWRRLLVLPYTKRWDLDGHAPDPQIRVRLTEGGPQRQAVLAWLVAGARKHLALRAAGTPLQLPACMVKAREAWRQEEEPIADFLQEQCVRDPDGVVLFRDLVRAFLAWRGRVSPSNRDWSDQVFWARFRQDRTVQEWALTWKARQKNVRETSVSRPSGVNEPIPKQALVIYGLRFG